MATTSSPTSYPTSVPTASPTYGPASEEVVALIEGSVIGGIFVIVILYIIYGYFSYEYELSTYLKSLDDEQLSGSGVIDGVVPASDDDDDMGIDGFYHHHDGEDRPLLKSRGRGHNNSSSSAAVHQ